ncbi:RadC family protein [Vibrio algivorus]|uniref:DNA repair protein RadC n=1 Tax=Vibrio algivorus TaxID=1667024 RepID=A0A557P5E6_9VIBR|nr:DNA repair protein RadC [Vibrio algivorus]TVO35890.1 DNA repair protein RadC [Vibrio algivorus]
MKLPLTTPTEKTKPVYYHFPDPITALELLEKAAEVISESLVGKDVYSNPTVTMEFLSCKLAKQEREIFSVMFLDNQHHLIEYQPLFYGTVNAASVYPREVVKAALALNASAIIVAHNHPSGEAEPSRADIAITEKLKQACELVDVRLLDHIVVGHTCVSLAQRGLV